MKGIPMRYCNLMAVLILSVFAGAHAEVRAELTIVTPVERQPLTAQVKRVAEALDHLGVPLPKADRQKLESAIAEKDDEQAVKAIQQVLDAYCLLGVDVNSETQLTVT